MTKFLKLIAPLLVLLRPVLVWLTRNRPYYHIKNSAGEIYMERYWLFKPGTLPFGYTVRLHKILKSDDDRALHDHPWAFTSIILSNGYIEVLGQWKSWDEMKYGMLSLDSRLTVTQDSEGRWIAYRWVGQGEINSADATTWHRLILLNSKPTWSLFISGKREHGWGFLLDGRKIGWKQYSTPEEVARSQAAHAAAGYK